MITVYVGIDPGTKNFAIAGLDIDGRATFIRMLRETIWSTAQENANLRPKFRRAIYNILKQLKPKQIMCESFVVRGFGTNNIELIAMMLGGIQVLADHLHIKEHCVMASTWKQALRRAGTDIDMLYGEAKAKRVPPHVVDALLIATFLRGGRTFNKFKLKLHQSNITFAAATLAPEDLMPLPKVKKANANRNGDSKQKARKGNSKQKRNRAGAVGNQRKKR